MVRDTFQIKNPFISGTCPNHILPLLPLWKFGMQYIRIPDFSGILDIFTIPDIYHKDPLPQDLKKQYIIFIIPDIYIKFLYLNYKLTQ